MQPRFDPNGGRLAFLDRDGAGGIWVHDLTRASSSLLTSSPDYDITPAWSPDGRFVAFASGREGAVFELFRKVADGSADAEKLTDSANGQLLGDWSPDGSEIAFTESVPERGFDVRILALSGEQDATTILGSEFNEADPSFSPDGKFLAYWSNESRRSEIYVPPYPELGAREQVSVDGGQYPAFSPNGRELFYQVPAGDGDVRFMVVEYTIEDGGFVAKRPRELVRGPYGIGPTHAVRCLAGRRASRAPTPSRSRLDSHHRGPELVRGVDSVRTGTLNP